MAKTLSRELPEGARRDGRREHRNAAERTKRHRRARTSDRTRASCGLPSPTRRGERISQRDLAAKAREILTREYPGVEVLQYPGGLVASVFANGYIAPLVVEVRSDQLDELDAEAKAVARVARSVPGIRDVALEPADRLPGDPRRDRSREGRAGRRHVAEGGARRRSRRRSATSTHPACGSMPTTDSRTTS